MNSKHGKAVAKLSSKNNNKTEYKDYNERLNNFKKDNPDVDYDNLNLTKAQKYSIDEYVEDSRYTNEFCDLRAEGYSIEQIKEMGELNDKQVQIIENRIKNLDNSCTGKLSQDIVTYRGLREDPSDIKVGSIINNKGYCSTSISKEVAEGFGEDYGFHIKLNVKSGTPALYIGDRKDASGKFNFHNMQELLFPRNSKIKITKIIDDEHFEGELYYSK